MNPPPEWDARLDDDLHRLTRRFAAGVARVRDGGDDEAVHDLRVATRRLEAALDLWRPLLRRGAWRRARRGLRALRRRLGPVREAEVDAATLRELLAALPPRSRIAATLLLARLTRRVVRRRRRAAAWCSTERLTRIRRRIIRAFARRRPATAADAPPAFRARLERFERRAREAVRAAGDARDESLHEARIATKRLRYALERCAAVGPPFDAPAGSERLAGLIATQDALGRHRDLTALQKRVTRFSRRLAVANPGMAAALEPVLALIASGRRDAVGSFGAGAAALDTVPEQPSRLGLAGGGPPADAEHG